MFYSVTETINSSAVLTEVRDQNSSRLIFLYTSIQHVVLLKHTSRPLLVIRNLIESLRAPANVYS